MRQFNLKDLLESEALTAQAFSQQLARWEKIFDDLLDVMLQFPYYFGELSDVKTDIGVFESFAHEHYILAPYTFWCVNDLCRKGHYAEAMVLLRRLLEVFIQLRYFFGHPEQLNPHRIATTAKNRVPFITMFDEFSPDYYHRFYGRMLSGMAHGGISGRYFRMKDGNVILGSQFDQKSAGFVVNWTAILALGFFNYVIKFFPKNTLSSAAPFDERRLNVVGVLGKLFKDNRVQFPEQSEWLDHMDRFVL